MSARYKYCIVPECPSTSIKTPDKLFISLPKNEKTRKAWQTAMRRTNFVSAKGSKFCCEDHFNVTEDIENYMYVKTMNSVRIKIKPGVIPHIFNCQQNRSVAHSSKPRALFAKKQRQTILSSLKSQPLEVTHTSPEKDEEVNPCELPFKNAGVQVHLKYKTQSKGIQCNFLARGAKKRKLSNTSLPSPPSIKKIRGSSGYFLEDNAEVSVSGSGSTSSFGTSRSSAFSFNSSLEVHNCKEQIQKRAIYIIEKNPKLYLGIPSESLFLVEMLSENAKLTKMEIFVTLKKIRINVPYSILADDFCISTTAVCLIIQKSIPILAAFLKPFIQWKSLTEIQNQLPIPFRQRYRKVQCIIDCFEISIQKPSDPILQSLTWSDYKNSNTMKYLISCTPDGLISFISKGFGGRSSDKMIVEESGFLDLLEPSNQVMADRGFKHVEEQLSLKNNTLVRPPSVSTGMKSTKEEVKESKRIASLRIHVERVISRIREFTILQPYAHVQLSLVKDLDFITKIVCGIINVQNYLVKI